VETPVRLTRETTFVGYAWRFALALVIVGRVGLLFTAAIILVIGFVVDVTVAIWRMYEDSADDEARLQ